MRVTKPASSVGMWVAKMGEPQVVRMGAGMTVDGPEPGGAGGYYLVVGNGSLLHGEEELPTWSMVVVEPTEEKFKIRAGDKGLEALVLQYPRDDLE
jgi:hypothetical protein